MKRILQRLTLGLLTLGVASGLSTAQAQIYSSANSTVKLTASDNNMQSDYFGYSVSLAGTLMAVGATNATSDINSTTRGGAVYLFQLGTDGIWTEIQKLTASDQSESDNFGHSVSLQPNGLVVGAPYANGGTGAVYFFAPDGSGSWAQKQVFRHCVAANDRCGYSVSLQSNSQIHRVVYGATGVAGDRGELHFLEATSADTSTWIHSPIPNSGAISGDKLGYTVALSGSRFVAGAYGQKVYLYELSNGAWTQQQTFAATSNGEAYASQVAMDGDRFIVSAPWANISGEDYSGKVYTYEYDGTNWGAKEILTATGNYTSLSHGVGTKERVFGHGVDIKGDRLIASGATVQTNVTPLGGRHIAYVFDQAGSWDSVQELGDNTLGWNIGGNLRSQVSLGEGRFILGSPGVFWTPGFVAVAREPTVGGMVSGLNGTLVLQNNGGDDLTLTTDGNFMFYTPVTNNDTYNVSVLTQPTGQNCSVAMASGTINASDISNVGVSCSDAYTISVNVLGLSGGTLVLQNNGGDDLTINSNGSHVFNTAINSGSAYDVTVLNSPSGLTCNVNNAGSGTAAGNVTNISVSCQPSTYIVIDGFES